MKISFIAGIIFLMMMAPGCKSEDGNQTESSGSYYTCPMHPSVIKKSPGSCPVCNMSLIKVDKTENEHTSHQGNFITIDRRKQELAGIKTDTVQMRSIATESVIAGTVSVDEEQVAVISSRAGGRIDQLFIKSTGTYIQRGTPLYSIYSEQLQADKKDYLSLTRKLKYSDSSSVVMEQFAAAAKNKLLLWGLSENQISELEATGSINPLITFYSSVQGYVTQVEISEGMYVQEGSPLFRIASLDQVWVEALLYPNEFSGMENTRSFKIFSDSDPEAVYHGKLVYSNPVINEGRRFYLLKIRVNNAKEKLIPGSRVSVLPETSTANVLTIPKSAVLIEKMMTVWVLSHDNTFEQRMVQTGVENKQWIEILSGVKEGEVIVSDGAYLINSEFILKSGAVQRHEH